MKSDSELMSELRAIFGPNNFKSNAEEYYDWKIFNNPFCTGKIHLEFKDDKVVGSTSLTPKSMLVFGERLLVGEYADGYTHPDYQRQGIYSRAVKECIDYSITNGINLIYGFPNPYSTPGSIKQGFLPSLNVKICGLKKFRHPFSYVKNQLVGRMRKKDLGDVHSFLSLILTMIQQWLFFIFANVFKLTERENSFNITRIDRLNEEIDGLWGGPRFNLFTIRDKTFINWRYFDNPDEYQVFFAQKGDEYLGYMVTKFSKDGKIGFICDFISVDDRMDVIHALIREAERLFINNKVDSIQLICTTGSSYYQAFLKHNYWDLGPGTQKSLLVYSGTQLGQALLSGEGPWHFTLSDSDII